MNFLFVLLFLGIFKEFSGILQNFREFERILILGNFAEF